MLPCLNHVRGSQPNHVQLNLSIECHTVPEASKLFFPIPAKIRLRMYTVTVIGLICLRWTSGLYGFFLFLRKKGSKTKRRMKEEEIEKGNCGPGPPNRKAIF